MINRLKLNCLYSCYQLFPVKEQHRIPTLHSQQQCGCWTRLIILLITTQQTASSNGPRLKSYPRLSFILLQPRSCHFPPGSHLQQRQVRVQVCEAVQNHRAAVLDHLQPHPVPYVPHPPRRVKHLEQLSRIDAVRLGLHPREIDHGCPRSWPFSHGDGGDIFTVFPRCFETKASLLLLLLRETLLLCWIIAAVFKSIMTQRGAFLNPAHRPLLPSGPSGI